MMVRILGSYLLGTVYLGLPVLVAAESPSSQTDNDLICSPIDQTDCYPKVFIPTEDFQPIREGQDIPSGLHVQLNVYTGEKQARLNIPMKGETDTSLLDLPTESSVIVVEQPEAEANEEQEKPAMRDQVPINPPIEVPAGKVGPPPASSNDEFSTFQKALLMLKMEARTFDTALDDLFELSHDIFYGVEVAKDGPVLEKLVCLTLGVGSERFPATENGREHKAASILAAAIQNNPTALQEIGAFISVITHPTCGLAAPGSQSQDFVSLLRSRLGKEKEPGTLRAKVSAISNLLKNPAIRSSLLSNHLMEVLLAIFLKRGEDFDIVRKKVALLVMDNFLDEAMGAQLGVWPVSPVSDPKTCETKERMLDDGCWEHHVAAFATSSGAEWAGNFMTALQSQRRPAGNSNIKKEL